eukprot:TRINITY_DN8134_c0_g1_i1.p1 TRINITY_DN8134_c0_g1~~TRINITY_DN8134_c0_g1_i1.p1  ORF type:complete len:348 (+),score=121.94 TRINITY_DN8134_c0_g1_i1:70-1113(+)
MRSLFFLAFAGAASATGAFGLGNETCCPDWAKCGGKASGKPWTGCTSCCNTRYFCKESSEYYSECVPAPQDPFPAAPPSEWCGKDGRTLNRTKLLNSDAVSSEEIMQIWNAATEGLTKGFAPGGKKTCIAAVSTALGECGHPAQSPWKNITDPVCSFGASGAGGIWQVTSQDKDDSHLAGCSDGTDPCCNARLAYAHAFNQGGATKVPDDYCKKQKSCAQIKSGCRGTSGADWNDPAVDAKKPGQPIPACSYKKNPWYPDGGASLASVLIDQEPCYWGPFSVAAGGVGKTFFPGFYGWGGYLQHYLESKAGMCDVSPQCQSPCDTEKYADYPTYLELAIAACGEDEE